ncbi:MAG: hypothetical protein JSV49_11280 [Thermoplasmata archaeon]|nr:MAG: hypothetical protein JSV49_11280 [Thermoplasmata archaeon]
MPVNFSTKVSRFLVALLMITTAMVGLCVISPTASADLQSSEVTVKASDDGKLSAKPLGEAVFTITYQNNEDTGPGSEDAYVLNFTVSPSFPDDPNDWNASVDKSSDKIYVAKGGGTANVWLRVRVAKNAIITDYKLITLSCEVQDDKGNTVNPSLSVTVRVDAEQKHSLIVRNSTGDPDTKQPMSTGQVLFNFTVNNTGNGEDKVSFSTAGAPGDTSVTPYTNDEIPAFTRYEFKLSVHNIPEDIKKGYHVVTLTVTSTNTSVKAQYNFIITVDPHYELDLMNNDTSTIKEIQPGSDIMFKFKAYNKGNSDEKMIFNATLDGEPPYWDVNVNPSSTTVDRGTYADITVIITAPNNDSYPHNIDVFVKASFQNSPSTFQENKVTVKLAQIQDIDIVVPGSRNLNETTRMVNFPITVQNKGNGEDTFEFSISGSFPVGELWNYEFSPNSITLDSKYGVNKEGMVDLNLTAPEDAAYGDFQITVEAFSSSDANVKDSSVITIIVGKLYNIAIYRQISEKQSAYPGDNVSIKFLAKNTGNFADTFYFDMEGPPETANWDNKFEPGFLNLNPDEEHIVYQNVSVDKDAAQNYYILTIRAESATDETKFDTFDVNISVRRKYEIEISTTSSTESTDPGSPASFMFTIRNRGTGACNVTMDKIMSKEISAYMNVKISPTTFELATAADTQVVWVNTTPSDTSPLATMNISTGVPITITADIDERDGGPEESEIVYVKINQTYDVQVWPDALEKTVKPGKTINFSLEIRNTGNGPDSYSIKTSGVLVTWSATLSTPNTQTLDKDGTEIVTLSVQVPVNEEREYDNITIDVTSRNAQADGLTVFQRENITVNVRSPVTGLNFSLTDGTRAKNTDPSGTVLFNLTATNTGVDVDKFTFEIDYTNKDMVKEWSMSLQTTDWLAPEESQDLQLSFKLKADAASDFVNITLSGTSKNNVNNVENYALSIWVNPIYELKVTYTATYPIPPNKAKPETNASFQIKIKNEGTGIDVVELEIDEDYPDITALFTDYTFVIDGSQSRTTTLTVIIPEEPEDLDITIRVTATSQKDDDDPPATDYVDVVFKIDPTREVDVSASETDLELSPNLEGSEASIDYDILITNKGKDKDSFTITVQVDNAYKSWFSYPAETAKIDADTSQTITVTVEVPNLRTPETLQFTVTATSVGNTDKSDIETFTLKIMEAYGIDLEAKDKVYKKSLDTDSTEVGNDRVVIFELEVINIGTASDNYEITTVESTHSNWATVSPAEVNNLASGLNTQVTVTVKVPKDTPIGDVKLTIKAISRGDDVKYDTNDAYDNQELWITITQIYDVYIPSPTTSKNGEPGDLIQFKFTIKNRGNGEDSVLLKLEDKGDWPWTLSTSAPTLQPAGSDGESKDITLSVVIPTDAEVKSSGYTVNLTMISDTPEGDVEHIARGDLEFTVTVDQEYAIKMSVTKNRLDGDPGDTVYFRIKVKNNGNGYDKFDLETTLEKSKDNIIPALDTQLSTDMVTLPPFEFTYVWLNVTIPDLDEVSDLMDIKAGDYHIKAIAKSRGEEIEYTLNMNVTINKDYQLEMTADNPAPSTDPMEATADDPDGVKFFVTVTNLGNEDDTAKLGALDNEPDEWDISFRVDNAPTQTISLEPGESQRVQVIVTFGEDVTASVDYAGITVKSTKNNQKYGLGLNDRIYIEVQIYQLKINNIEFSESSPQEGDKVTVTADIQNTGAGDAEDIIVTFKDGSALLKTVEVDKIEAGDTEKVQIEWDVTEGKHNIVVEVEQYDGSTTTQEKAVSPKAELFSQSTQYNLILAIIILSILLAVMAAFTVRRRRELPPDIKAELMKLRKESELRKGRELGEKPSPEIPLPEKETALPTPGKFKELPPGPDEEEMPRKATKIKCPKCDRIQTVPSPKRPIEFECDDCGQKLVLRKK